MSDGAVLQFTMRIGGVIPVQWTARHSEVGSEGFVDTMIEGPVRSWVHKHKFIAIDEGNTMVEDNIVYEYGPGVRGFVALLLFNPLALRVLFGWRAFATRRRLLGQPHQEVPLPDIPRQVRCADPSFPMARVAAFILFAIACYGDASQEKPCSPGNLACVASPALALVQQEASIVKGLELDTDADERVSVSLQQTGAWEKLASHRRQTHQTSASASAEAYRSQALSLLDSVHTSAVGKLADGPEHETVAKLTAAIRSSDFMKDVFAAAYAETLAQKKGGMAAKTSQ